MGLVLVNNCDLYHFQAGVFHFGSRTLPVDAVALRNPFSSLYFISSPALNCLSRREAHCSECGVRMGTGPLFSEHSKLLRP